MSTQIHAYLTFNGNCREAMNFYKECLGGTLTLQTVGESPLSEKMPARMKACILHSTLKKDAWVLLGTDMVGEQGLIKGNSVSLMLHCSSEEEIRTVYQKLSAGGTPVHLPESSARGAVLGNLTDKFGNHWLLHYEKNEPAQ